MSEILQPGQDCRVREAIVNRLQTNKKYKNHVQVPAEATVTLTAVSGNMAFIRYNGQAFSTRLENLLC